MSTAMTDRWPAGSCVQCGKPIEHNEPRVTRRTTGELWCLPKDLKQSSTCDGWIADNIRRHKERASSGLG